jgi:hypothetical protein
MSQIFREIPPADILLRVLQNICDPPSVGAPEGAQGPGGRALEEGPEKVQPEFRYVVDHDAYKRFQFHGYDFAELEPFYHVAKRKYLRTETYTRFCTVIRQLCNVLDIPIEIEHKYCANKYYSIYTISV